MLKRILISLISLVVFATILNSCGLFSEAIEPEGNVVKQERNLNSSFKNLSVGGSFELILTQSDAENLSIEANENLHEHIISEVKDNTLKIYIEDNISFRNANVKIYVSCNSLENIKLSGASETKNLNWKAENLNINLSGASELEGNLEVKENLNFHLSGASEVKLAGRAANLQIKSSGASENYFYDFVAENVTLDISGAGKAEINVNSTLSVSASGASEIYYKGKGELIKCELSGVSEIKKVD